MCGALPPLPPADDVVDLVLADGVDQGLVGVEPGRERDDYADDADPVRGGEVVVAKGLNLFDRSERRFLELEIGR